MRKHFFKYCSLDEYTLQNIEKNQLYFNLAQNLNDPFEVFFDFKIDNDNTYKRLIETMYDEKAHRVITNGKDKDTVLDHSRSNIMTQFLKGMRLTCFSSVNDSILMWGHYGKSHTGICIEYADKDPIFTIAQKVEYSEKTPILELNSEADADAEVITRKLISIFSTKHKAWEYEKEYRIFGLDDTCIHKLKPGTISAIYFGLFCSNDNAKKVREILGNGVRYYHASLNPKIYRIDFEEMN